MTTVNIHSFAEEAERLMHAYTQIIEFSSISENKQRAASAKARNLSRAISSHFSNLKNKISENDVQLLIIDLWRLMFAHERAISILPASEKQSASADAESFFDAIFFHIFKMKSNIKIIAFEGKHYESNRPVRAVNADDFPDNESLMISETLEPALVKDGRVLHFAKVALTNTH